MTVVKMRGSSHSKDLRLYDVTERGVEMGETLHDYHGIVTGVALHRQVTEVTSATPRDAATS